VKGQDCFSREEFVSGPEVSRRICSREARQAKWILPIVHLRATVGNLRLPRERRLVDQNSASWNRISEWLRRLDAVCRAA
jgi:hypothetical protein